MKEKTLSKRVPKQELLEKLAALEHAQWISWSRAVAEEVSAERVERWRNFWVPYEDLPEEVKQLDRVWAEQVIRILGEAGYLEGDS